MREEENNRLGTFIIDAQADYSKYIAGELQSQKILRIFRAAKKMKHDETTKPRSFFVVSVISSCFKFIPSLFQTDQNRLDSSPAGLPTVCVGLLERIFGSFYAVERLQWGRKPQRLAKGCGLCWGCWQRQISCCEYRCFWVDEELLAGRSSGRFKCLGRRVGLGEGLVS